MKLRGLESLAGEMLKLDLGNRDWHNTWVNGAALVASGTEGAKLIDLLCILLNWKPLIAAPLSTAGLGFKTEP